jgi:hypothetical protein
MAATILSLKRAFVYQSYGGFMSAKVVEANAGIHSLAMSVAVSSLISSFRQL